ncbi:MAG: hypothetical protein K0V04_24905 [Deltaproteobacteria bacterium]|nr:hypothetical protein [Deltaproteobacteria bacterium]
MAIEPLTVGLMSLAGYGLYSHSRRKRTVKRRPPIGPTAPTKVPKTPLLLADDCSSWDMPELWILQTAQPRFRRLLDEVFETTRGDLAEAKSRGLLDAVSMTYAILDGEIGTCPEPLVHAPDGSTLSFRELQTDIDSHPDYYPHPAILGLFDTIFEAVEAALTVLEQTGDPGRALLFPV